MMSIERVLFHLVVGGLGGALVVLVWHALRAWRRRREAWIMRTAREVSEALTTSPGTGTVADVPEQTQQAETDQDARQRELRRLTGSGLLTEGAAGFQAELGTCRVVDEVIAERYRHRSKLGFTPDHNDEYTQGELVDAACCCAFGGETGSLVWPWSEDPPSHCNDMAVRRRNLVKAAALIVAEIERVDRLEARGGE